MVITFLVALPFGWPGFWVRMGLRAALVPLVAGLAFEVIRLAGAHRDWRWLQLLVSPGLWMQRLTTRAPAPEMVEVAVAALRAVLKREEERARQAA
jgi:uncharacterized protein YqhQ